MGFQKERFRLLHEHASSETINCPPSIAFNRKRPVSSLTTSLTSAAMCSKSTRDTPFSTGRTQKTSRALTSFQNAPRSSNPAKY